MSTPSSRLKKPSKKQAWKQVTCFSETSVDSESTMRRYPPCEGGFQYLRRSNASRTRPRKGTHICIHGPGPPGWRVDARLTTLLCKRTSLLTYPRSWALLEEPPIVQPLKNFPAFYGTRKFNTVFTRALHWSLSWVISIQSTIKLAAKYNDSHMSSSAVHCCHLSFLFVTTCTINPTIFCQEAANPPI
jgi:hypothetical protein